MGTLTFLASRFLSSRPLAGATIGVSLHITKETAVLVDSLVSLGAEVAIASANPLSTQDDIAAFLATKARVFAWKGETQEEYAWCHRMVLDQNPGQLIDDGGDLHVAAHLRGVDQIVGGSEETTTGVNRLKALEAEGKLRYPVIAVNDARTKFLFDNRHGTGQSTFDGILRATSLLLSGKEVVVVGYGCVGKGVAERARGLGCKVTVVEVDPVKALEAHLDGFVVSEMFKASTYGNLFITGTGQKSVISYESIMRMRDGAVLANAGHFDVEIDIRTMFSRAKAIREVRPFVKEIRLENGKKVFVLAEGRVANLVVGEGHPPEVMQMSFANQLLAAIRIRKSHSGLRNQVYAVDRATEEEISRAALKSMGIRFMARDSGKLSGAG